MLYAHEFDGLCHTPGLILIILGGASGGDRAKRTTASAYISENHERGRAGTPTFAHVRAISAFTNGMQLILVDQFAYLGVLGTDGQFHPQPIRLAFFCFFLGDDWQFDHVGLVSYSGPYP